MQPIVESFIEQILKKLIPDHRFLGLLGGGSMMAGTMDEYSDLDLVVVYEPSYRSEIMNERLLLAEQWGSLLSAFTGEHVGEPRLVICLYGPPPLHVDFKFVMPGELEERIENPLILWERGSRIGSILQKTSPHHPSPDPQWIEDRFWVWVHYGAAKLGRGELFELIDLLTFVRSTVLGPLIAAASGHLPRGVRRLEQQVPDKIAELETTVPSHDADSCYEALKSTIRLYQRLRPNNPSVLRRTNAEQVSLLYLDQVYRSLSTP